MSKSDSMTGFAIAIAWPETYCKQPGSWYDSLANFLKISQNHYFKVGHAALVLVDSANKSCHYFDFGRYHTPFRFGRVRSALTDHDLAIKSIPKVSADANILENFHDILHELQNNPSCHGQGKLHASYCKINFEQAFVRATQLQRISPIPYGPFRLKGTNCSRFVNTSLLAGNPGLVKSFKLKFLVPFTPMPLNNVKSFSNIVVLDKQLTTTDFCPPRKTNQHLLQSTLPEPLRHESVPVHAQWLSGEGSGSWFAITQNDTAYKITRQSQEGTIECSGLFKVSGDNVFNVNEPYYFDHLSHCNLVRIRQHQKIILFEAL